MIKWIANRVTVWKVLSWFGWGICFIWDENGNEAAYLSKDISSQGWRIY